MKNDLSIKKVLLVLYLALVGTIQVNAQCSSANVYAFTFNQKKYELVKEKKTWAQAAACAVTKNAHLLQIDNAEEQTAVYNAIVASEVPTDYNPVSDAGNVSYIWTGATDKNTEGTWLWDGDDNNEGINFWNGQGANGANDGSAVLGRYNNWGKANEVIREPDDFNSDQDAAGIALSITPSGSTHAGEWNDIAITNTLYYILEYGETATVPETIKDRPLTLILEPGKEVLKLIMNTTVTNADLRLFNIAGQLLMERTSLSGVNFDLSVTGLASGIYLIELTQQNGIRYQEKLIISN
jgi:hypothetical protein